MLISVIGSLAARLLRTPFPVVLVCSGVLISLLPDLPYGLEIFYRAELAEQTIMLILLPIMIFEAAYRFDVSKFAANWGAIFFMALPGVLFSTLIITAGLLFFSQLSPAIALLLGIILSATDPSATIAIFKESGAPKDLITIVEGESLLNDATVIALYKIVILVLAMHLSPSSALAQGLWQLLWLFGIGALLGWCVGQAFLWLMKYLPDDPFLEISISLMLGIGCFLFVGEYVQASGIVALTTCGLILAKNSPLPITNKSNRYLDSFWTYLSDLAKAFIFILVGMWLDIGLIMAHWGTTLLVVISMLIARSLFVYGVLPYFGQLRRHAYILPKSYQHICLWGGMRGAVTLALALIAVTHSPEFAQQEHEALLAVAMGAVLFTMLVQGLTLSPLASRLALDDMSMEDRITEKELTLSAMKTSMKALEQLIQSPLATNGTPQEFLLDLKANVNTGNEQLQHLYNSQIGNEGLYKRLIMKGLSIEAGYLHLLYDQGMISVAIYQQQKELLDQQMDAARHGYRRPSFSLISSTWLKKKIVNLTHSKDAHIVEQYEMAWSRFLTSDFTLSELEQALDDPPVERLMKENIMKIWEVWRNQSEQVINQLDKQYPVITAKAQRGWLRSMLHTIQKAHLNKFVRQNFVSASDSEKIAKALANQIQDNHNEP